MSRRIADLLIKIGADSYEFQQRTKQVEKSLEGLQKKMTSVGKTLSKTLTLPLVALGTASVMAADTQVQAETRLLTALKGREDIQRRLMAQAAELQSRSTFGDEEVIAQQAYLASLGMTERQINDVIEASAQLSTATGMTLESAVKNLAKTYGGLTGELGESIPALKSLTAEQLKSGEAVKYILENYQGYAEAAAQSGAGSMRQLKNQLGDLAEQLGMILMPALQKIVGWISNMVTWFQNLSPTTQKVIVVIASLAAAIGPVLTVGGKLLAMLPLIKAAFTAMTGPIGLVISALVALGAAFVSARQQQAEFARQQAEQARQNFEERKRENYDRTYNEFSRPIYSDEDIQKRMKIVYETWAEDKAAFERIQNGKGFTQAQADALNVQREEWLALNDILNQRRRSAEDAAAMQAQYNNSLKQTTTGAAEANGLIGQLQAQIRALEESLGNAKTVEEIAATNAQIAELRGELSRLQDIKPEDLKPIEKLEPILASDFEIEFPAPKLKMDGIKLAVSEYSQQMQEIFSTVREGLFCWAQTGFGMALCLTVPALLAAGSVGALAALRPNGRLPRGKEEEPPAQAVDPFPDLDYRFGAKSPAAPANVKTVVITQTRPASSAIRNQKGEVRIYASGQESVLPLSVGRRVVSLGGYQITVDIARTGSRTEDITRELPAMRRRAGGQAAEPDTREITIIRPQQKPSDPAPETGKPDENKDDN